MKGLSAGHFLYRFQMDLAMVPWEREGEDWCRRDTIFIRHGIKETAAILIIIGCQPSSYSGNRVHMKGPWKVYF